ncbi:MAG: AraC family transcriptional regulator [Variovorax sp.]
MDATVPQESPAFIGLQVDVIDTPGGTVSLAPLPDHRIRVHAGPAVRGVCHAARFVYRRGDVDIVVPGQSESWQEDGPGRSLVLRLPPVLLERTAGELDLPAGRAGLVPRHQLRDPQIEYIAWALQADRAAGSPNGRLYVQSLATALAVHLLGRHAAPRREPRRLSAVQLKRVGDYIDERLDQDLSLPVLAAIVHTSASHFKTLFKRSTGLAVHQYVIQRRVRRARHLLLVGQLPASQVALEAGFAHQSHMARCMRRVLGVTPTALQAGRHG